MSMTVFVPVYSATQLGLYHSACFDTGLGELWIDVIAKFKLYRLYNIHNINDSLRSIRAKNGTYRVNLGYWLPLQEADEDY